MRAWEGKRHREETLTRWPTDRAVAPLLLPLDPLASLAVLLLRFVLLALGPFCELLDCCSSGAVISVARRGG